MSIYKFNVMDVNNKLISMEKYKNKVLLIVNVASKCAFTPQYKELEDLYKKYQDKDFIVLAFPCNQFREQEPGSMEEIKSFCSLKYNITFPIFSKIEVNGKKEEKLYSYLKTKAPGIFNTKSIKWNFTKFLIDRNGEVIKRFAPNKKLKDLEVDIESLL